jgi:hypothetical protein
MSEKYTIEKNGQIWIASDGINHIEGEEPDEALYNLLIGEVASEELNEPIEDSVGDLRQEKEVEKLHQSCLRLIKLTTIGAPKAIVANELIMIKNVIDSLPE